MAVGESVRLVLNRTSERPRILHREGCPSIQHQARGDLREELPRGGFRVFESYEDGSELVRPIEGADQTYYAAVYVTLDDCRTWVDTAGAGTALRMHLTAHRWPG